VILEGPLGVVAPRPGAVAPPALHSVQEPLGQKQSSATPVRTRAWLCGEGGSGWFWGGGGGRMVLPGMVWEWMVLGSFFE
jgi:hypothetical protein